MGGWRVLPFHVASAARQLELTEALWREVAAGETPATLRWYSYDTAALVLGIGQSERDTNLQAAQDDGVTIVKRASGGALVLARPGLLALDVALPSTSPLAIPDVVESYRWLGEAFSQALPARVRLASPADARADQRAQREAAPGMPARARALACFGVLSPYEVTLDGRKLVGFSQVRKRGVTLYQAGVYVTLSGEELARYLPPLPGLDAEIQRRVADLAALGLTSSEDFMEAVTRAIEESAPSA
jgi:lipoate-protein ligase A